VRDPERQVGQFTRRGLFIGGLMGGFLVVLGGRARYLGVEQADEFKLLAEENRINLQLLAPARGLILDRNGRLLAGNEQNYRVTLTREGAGDVDLVLDRLSHVIAMTAADMTRIQRDIQRNPAFVPITVADRLTWEAFSRINLNAPILPGVTPDVGLSRIYPRDTDFAHVVGYVGPVSEKDLEDLEIPDPLLRIPNFQIGKSGVERWREDDLRGAAGTKKIEVNSLGRVMRELERNEGTPGEDLVLTIDADVQNFIAARLGDQSAAVMVMDVTNGDIIASVSAPSFDPNLFVRGISSRDYSVLTENDHKPLANKVVQGGYPPGSTFKMVTALAALNAGVIQVDDHVNCPGYLQFGDRKFHCWKRGGHGRVNLGRALAESCDVYFYDTAQKVGIDAIAEMGRKLGLGIRHDLPLSAISAGAMPDKAWKMEKYKQEWRVGDTINASIGQGYVLTTPLQLCVMTARLATGTAVVPRVVKAIGGKELPVAPAESLGLDGSILRAVREGMSEVMNNSRGTGYGSRTVDVSMLMGGKSGTAQVRNISAAERETGVVANNDLPWKFRDHALFVAFAPVEAPRYAVAVLVEHGGGGSAVAGPIARDALLRVLSGTTPPLEAYPANQRARMETLLNELKLRSPDGTRPLAGKA
jgi:penicillin-binding protein 2